MKTLLTKLLHPNPIEKRLLFFSICFLVGSEMFIWGGWFALEREGQLEKTTSITELIEAELADPASVLYMVISFLGIFIGGLIGLGGMYGTARRQLGGSFPEHLERMYSGLHYVNTVFSIVKDSIRSLRRKL